MLMPSLESDPRLLHLLARYQRGAATPRVAAEHFRYVFNFDARAVLSSIAAPTLVLHRTSYPIVGIEHGQYLAEHITNARLIEFPGREATFILSREADMPFDSILEFLTGMPADSDSDRALATVLFCDIVGSTERAADLGDVAWRRLLDRYFALVRNEVTRSGGREIDTAGDGFFAAFDRPTRAIRCAVAIRDTVGELDLQVRCGLHTAECMFTGGRLSGIAVHIGARVAAAAAPSEVWLTETVKNLVAGSGIRFSGRGTHALKGVPGEWPLYAAP
jgi:class 3 adenylate cyclase